MKLKKLVSVLLVAACVFSLAACGSKDDSKDSGDSKKDSKDTLVMATNAEFPPYEFHEGDDVVGIDADIARAIGEEMGMEVKIEDMAFDSIIPAVTSGKADFGAAGMTVTEDRKKNVDFTDTYATATQVIIVKEGSDIAGPDDLTGKKIGVQLGTTGDIYADDIEDAEVERYNKGFEAVQALTQDKIDAVVIDGEPAKEFVAEADGLKILDEAFNLTRREMVQVPIVGRVAAGEPLLAQENIEEYYPIPVEFLPNNDCFMLKVKGESMINAGILDGDYVVVSKCNTASNGDMVVALIDDGATVKTFYREEGFIRLQPENDSMEPFILENVDILGKVYAVFRFMR